MPPRFGGEPVEQESAPRFKGEAVAEDTSYLPPINPPKEKKPTIGERGKEVGFATGLSAAAGAIAPEILMYGVAPAAGVFAPTAPFAPAIYGAGAALRGSRLAQAGLGAIGGFTGEGGGQVAEASGASPATAAIPKATNAAPFTDDALATPDPTNRSGPTRTASVPLMPSE